MCIDPMFEILGCNMPKGSCEECGACSPKIEESNEAINQQGDYIRPDLTPGQWAIFWDSQTPDRYIIARYSHSERTTPFDRHWTQGKEYFAECKRIQDFDLPMSSRWKNFVRRNIIKP